MAKEKSHDTSLRADMEAAMEEVESGAEPTEEVESAPAEHAESEPVAQEETEAKTEVSEPVETAPATEVRAEVDRKQPAREVKPPVDWTPALREKWKGVDPEVRQWINNRQVQTDQLLQTTAAARKFGDEFVRMIEPYRAVMVAHGTDNPLVAINGLFRTVTTLTTGAPVQKAHEIARMINYYAVPIETLDQVLAGSMPEPDPQESAVNRIVEQRLNPILGPISQLLERVNYAEQSQQQQIYGQAHQSIEQFGTDPRNEFFEDVRHDMADFLDMAAQRGVTMSLKDAYDRALAINPGVQQVLQTRAQPRTLRDKRSAASSLAARGTEGNHSTERSLREELEAQWGDDARIA